MLVLYLGLTLKPFIKNNMVFTFYVAKHIFRFLIPYTLVFKNTGSASQ